MENESNVVQEEQEVEIDAYDDSLGIDSSISVPSDEEEATYSLTSVENLTIEEVDISTWAFIGFGSCAVLLVLSIGVSTILRMIRGSM